MSHFHRRQFLKSSIGVISVYSAIAGFFSRLAFGEKLPPLLSETDPLAKNFKYVSEASRGNRVPKAGVQGADQSCSNCLMYTKLGSLEGGEVGRCNFFVGKCVKSGGWCTQWVPKPAKKG